MATAIKQTHSSLLEPAVGEWMAREKYPDYAAMAEEDGWYWIAKIVYERARNEWA